MFNFFNKKRKIKDITINEIILGKNWKLTLPEDFDIPMEEWEIQDTDTFNEEDNIVYSAIFVTKSGKVTPLVLLKEVGDLDYGGDYCEYLNGKWSQVGLVANPNMESTDEYIANPLEQDPSFDADDDYRAEHRENFKKWSEKLLSENH